MSSTYFPHSNLRAETAVKSMKLLITANTSQKGTLDTDEFSAALMQYRNTPDRDTGLSPAQVLYARKLRDTVPCSLRDLQLRPEWVLPRDARERALSKRHQNKEQELSLSTKVLEPLSVGGHSSSPKPNWATRP